jgi:hypothetical protein
MRLGPAWLRCMDACTSPFFCSTPQARTGWRVFQTFSYLAHARFLFSLRRATVALASSRAHWVILLMILRAPRFAFLALGVAGPSQLVLGRVVIVFAHHYYSISQWTCPIENAWTRVMYSIVNQQSLRLPVETHIVPSGPVWLFVYRLRTRTCMCAVGSIEEVNLR